MFSDIFTDYYYILNNLRIIEIAYIEIYRPPPKSLLNHTDIVEGLNTVNLIMKYTPHVFNVSTFKLTKIQRYLSSKYQETMIL